MKKLARLGGCGLCVMTLANTRVPSVKANMLGAGGCNNSSAMSTSAAKPVEAIDNGTEAFKITINLLSNTIFSEDFAQTSGTAGEFKDVVTNITKLVGLPNVADFFPMFR